MEIPVMELFNTKKLQQVVIFLYSISFFMA